MSHQQITPANFKRLNCNTLGHPRYVIDHTWLLTDAERFKRREAISNSGPIFEYNEIFDRYYRLACDRANKIGGRKYSTKAYRAGICFTSFSLDETIEFIHAKLAAADAPSQNAERKRQARSKIAHEILKGD